MIVTDLRMPDGVGLDVLHTAKVLCPDANVILLTAYPAWESAKEAMRLGAFDYFEKGQEPDGLFRRIDRALEEQASRRRIGLVSPATHPALPASPEGEHRYLTVLFADMRGSTELLAGLDLDGARQILDGVIERLMAAAHEAGGTVNQVMGDGIMAMFGAPVARPDHAARACRAALLMQDTVAAYARTLPGSHRAEIQIRVEDSGAGIDPEIAARIFDPFFTTKPQGLGMGLSISRSIVEAHEGRLWSTARAGQGACFQFALPVDESRSG